MKKLILLVIFCLGISFGIFSQEKDITENEFSQIYNISTQQLKDNSYRVRQIFENENNNIISPFGNSIVSEIVSPNKKRIISERKAPKSNQVTEIIILGDKRYVRVGSEDWKEKPLQQSEKTDKTSPLIIIESDGYKLIGTETLNGEKTNVYQRSGTKKFASNANSKTVVYLFKSTYWFNKNGFLLKYVGEEQTPDIKVKKISRQIWIYEYDDSIKIEAPKMP